MKRFTFVLVLAALFLAGGVGCKVSGEIGDTSNVSLPR